MIVAVLLVVSFVGVLIGMTADMVGLFKEIKNEGKESKGLESRGIFHPESRRMSKGKHCVDTGELRA